MSTLKQKLSDFLSQELSEMGFELVEFELSSSRKPLLRLYVDRLDETKDRCTLNVSDCESLSRSIQRIIDVEQLISGDYTLEVSTPGLDRPLFKISDYERFNGKLVSFVLNEPQGGAFIGKINSVKGSNIVFDISGSDREIKFSYIKKARLKFER